MSAQDAWSRLVTMSWPCQGSLAAVVVAVVVVGESRSDHVLGFAVWEDAANGNRSECPSAAAPRTIPAQIARALVMYLPV